MVVVWFGNHKNTTSISMTIATCVNLFWLFYMLYVSTTSGDRSQMPFRDAMIDDGIENSSLETMFRNSASSPVISYLRIDDALRSTR